MNICGRWLERGKTNGSPAKAYLLQRVDELADGLVSPVTNLVPGKSAEVLIGRFCRRVVSKRHARSDARIGREEPLGGGVGEIGVRIRRLLAVRGGNVLSLTTCCLAI